MASSSRSAAVTEAASGISFASPCSATVLEAALLEAKKNEAPRREAECFSVFVFEPPSCFEVFFTSSFFTSRSAPNDSATARQHRDRCAAAAPAESPMMSSQPQRCSFHICTSSPGERDCRNVSGSTTSGWYCAIAGGTSLASASLSFLSFVKALRDTAFLSAFSEVFFPSFETETASATSSSAARAFASPPASFVKSPLTNAVTSGRLS